LQAKHTPSGSTQERRIHARAFLPIRGVLQYSDNPLVSASDYPQQTVRRMADSHTRVVTIDGHQRRDALHKRSVEAGQQQDFFNGAQGLPWEKVIVERRLRRRLRLTALQQRSKRKLNICLL